MAISHVPFDTSFEFSWLRESTVAARMIRKDASCEVADYLEGVRVGVSVLIPSSRIDRNVIVNISIEIY